MISVFAAIAILGMVFSVYRVFFISDSMPFFSKSSSKQWIHDLFAQADIQLNGARPWDIQVRDEAFYRRLMRHGSLGFGESYMEGMWDCEQLDECVHRLVRANLYEKAPKSWLTVWMAIQGKLYNLQDRLRSMVVIDKHYQIGNELYQAMLGPTLAYSCGYWKEAVHLDQAQEAKFDLICKKLYFKPGMKVLDIGCGWGGFAKYAAERYGVHVVGITLSQNQAEHARMICLGLPVEIHIADYRDMNAPFDRVLEIGMFEHVGVKNYREFMDVVYRCLKEDGLFLLHTIGSNESAEIPDPWIHKYIFPNGHLPSIAEIGHAVEGLFILEDWHNFGPDYDKTLMAWNDNFNKSKHQLSNPPDTTFCRMWRYYLLSCAGTFRARSIQLWQVVFSKSGDAQGYTSVR